MQPFKWQISGVSKGIKIDGQKITFYAAAYMSRPDDPRCGGPSGLDGKYLQLPRWFGGYVVSCHDLFKHVEDPDDLDRDQILSLDIEHGSPCTTCTFWNINEKEIDKATIDKSRLGKVLSRLCTELKTSEERLQGYRQEWVLCMNFATSVSSQNTPTYYRNPFNRFYKLKKELPIYILPGQSIRNDMLAQIKLVAAMREAAGSDPNVIASLIDDLETQKNIYICLSTNPLGFYSTWIKSEDLELLVYWQTGGHKWAEEPPSAGEIELYNIGRLGTGQRIWKQDSPEPTRYCSLLQWPGQTIQFYKRRSTESVMGSSANKWATTELGWLQKRSHRAEWLHILAHRFEPNTGDRYSNLILGTKECNTDMMRAEAAVEQLLFSGKVSAVGVQVKVQHDLKSVTILDYPRDGTFQADIKSTWADLVGKFPKWLALEIEYSIHYYVCAEGERWKSPPGNWTTRFHPFSAQCPLFFEYILDRIFLDKLLASHEFSVEPGYKSTFTELCKESNWHVQPQKLSFPIPEEEDSDDEYYPLDQKAIEREDAKFQAKYEREYDISATELEIEGEAKLKKRITRALKKAERRQVRDGGDSGLVCAAINIQKGKGLPKDRQEKIGASNKITKLRRKPQTGAHNPETEPLF